MKRTPPHPATGALDRLIGGETQLELLRLLRRSPRSIPELSAQLGLTDNAVRGHVAALGRDGLVEAAGTQRDTGGKPARLYGLTREGEELFPKAYATVLGGVVDEIIRTEGAPLAIALLRAVGERSASSLPSGSSESDRVEGAADALRGLGADIDVERTNTGWRLQGYACPLSAVTAEHGEVCALVTALVERIAGLPVTECCNREGRPRCAFAIAEGR